MAAPTTMRAAAAFLLLAMLVVIAQVASPAAAAPTDLQSHRGGGRGSPGGGGRLLPQSCSPACDHRCSQTQYHKPCIKYCNLCCQKCLCVPPGFYGNKQVCPCYAGMKNARGGPKCP